MAVAIRDWIEDRERLMLMPPFPEAETSGTTTDAFSDLSAYIDFPRRGGDYGDLLENPYLGLTPRFAGGGVIATAILLDERRNTTLPIFIDLPGPCLDKETVAGIRDSRNELKYEEAFERMGLWGGPHSSREALEKQWEFWREQGSRGSAWLLEKVGRENGNESMNAAANVLANMGPDSGSLILQHLRGSLSVEQAYCLLDALARLGPQAGAVEGEFADLLRLYLLDEDIDLRLAAVTATSALSPRLALEILDLALAEEEDSDVRRAISDEIRNRRAD
jgi:hypothetical protein